MYFALLLGCKHCKAHLKNVKKHVLRLELADVISYHERSFAGPAFKGLSNSSANHGPACRFYSTSAKPSMAAEQKENKRKTSRQKVTQYEALVKALEAYKSTMKDHKGLKLHLSDLPKDFILTIPSDSNVISILSPDHLKITCVDCKTLKEPCYTQPGPAQMETVSTDPVERLKDSAIGFNVHSAESIRVTEDRALKNTALIQEDAFGFDADTLAEFSTGLHSDLTVHTLESDFLRAAFQEEDGESIDSEDLAKMSPTAVTGGAKKKKKSKKSSLKLGSKEREVVAKVKKEELMRKAKEVQLQNTLNAFIDVCVNANLVDHAHSTLHFYRFKGKSSNKEKFSLDINTFNRLLQGFAHKGKKNRMHELLKTMEHDKIVPSLETYAAILECYGRQSSIPAEEIEKVIFELEQKGYDLADMLTNCKFYADQRDMALKAIHNVRPFFQPKPLSYPQRYVNHLLDRLSEVQASHHSATEENLNFDDLKRCASEQLSLEIEGQLSVKSVVKISNPTERMIFLRKQLDNNEKHWRTTLKESFLQNLKTLHSHSFIHRGMSLYPYLAVLDPDCYVNVMIQEIRHLAEASETFSPAVSVLHYNLGSKVMTRYLTWVKQNNGIAAKIESLYTEYLKYCISPELRKMHSPREYWQTLKVLNSSGPSMDYEEIVWPYHTLLGVGRFLYDILLHDVKIDINVLRHSSSTKRMIPAFYNIYRNVGPHTKEEIKPHPLLTKLYRGANREDLVFDVNLVPMISPPLPWSCAHNGVFLLTQTPFVRLSGLAGHQKVLLENTPLEQLYPSFDSLNILGMCPWIINKPMLDLVIQVFLNKGSDELDIPMPPSECAAAPKFQQGMSKSEKQKVARERLALKRKRAEMYSLWCDALYKLSIANHFRDQVFWFPHNMDFRGRVYPCPPHFNHLGSDVTRSILLFAKGEPLGKKGLNWLKIHLINLTGLKKRDPVHIRLEYADEIMDEILDSADNPMTGRQWWTKSDEPWQTLACCKEIANAIRSGDPENYISHFPVHQDGSCNGLQHYAALGRDQHGAEQVNLHPMDTPQDVYSGVAALVERERAKDAASGVKIAMVLEGFVKRKVVKQTVMTVVYGVTRFGAHLQIMKQLKDIPEFPQEHCWPAAHYLVQKTFFSLQEMFTATRQIQDWFTDCAKLISQVCGQPVEWVTPLGLPVIQPYHRASLMKSPTSFGDRICQQYLSRSDMFERPNIMKQKNAFPPNFIHSLDSTHMMLTALYSQREGITFVSVHDCYWTHPNTVDIMNRVCREQFVALHSEPLLENLSVFLVRKFGYKESELQHDGSLGDLAKKKLNRILTQIPQKGTFCLENVLKSTYFFS